MKCPGRVRDTQDLTFEQCCGPIIEGKRVAQTAEEVMRSRYTAYAQNKIDHIEKSQATNDDFDHAEASKWALSSDWLGMDVVTTKQETPNMAIVEFKAYYKEKSAEKVNVHHEYARFSKKNNQWLYEDGKIMGLEPYVRQGDKVGRNDPCLCGSGKKYKKCCGA